MRGMLGWVWEHRRRFAPLVLGAGVLLVGGEILGATPHDVEVELPLGAGHEAVRRVDVAYTEDGDLVRRVSLRFPEGAPAAVRDTVELAPGRYAVRVELVRGDGATEARQGSLEAPAAGVVQVHLREGGGT